ncbi:hypothetical protein ScPMuIL_000843 [Solemya velum]
MKFVWKLLLFVLLVLPTTILVFENGNSGLVVRAEEGSDPVEGEDDDDDDEATVETEDTESAEGAAVTEGEKTDDDEEEEEADELLKPSPDADAILLFTKPTGTTDLPAGHLVRFLVGFTNKGEQDFVVENMEASFRYPQDYSFYIQNFTTNTYNQIVEPKKEATFDYSFNPSESFSSRPFGLTVLVNYKDNARNPFQHAVFNETVNVVEPDEGLDGETFFLYVFLAAIVVLLLVGAQQLLSTFGRKHLTSKPRPPVEMGTQNSDIDYDWLPKETLQGMNQSPRRSPKQSLRQRRNKRATGSGEE